MLSGAESSELELFRTAFDRAVIPDRIDCDTALTLRSRNFANPQIAGAELPQAERSNRLVFEIVDLRDEVSVATGCANSKCTLPRYLVCCRHGHDANHH